MNTNTSMAQINDEYEDEIDLLEIFEFLKEKFKTIAFFSMLGGLAAFLVCTFLMTPKYKAYIDLYVTNTSSFAQTTEFETVNVNDITASQKLVSTYRVVLQTDSAINRVRAITGTELSKRELLNMVEFSVLDNTEILRITATTDDPYKSVKLCNGYAAIAAETVTDVVNGGSVKILSNAIPDGTPTSPNTRMYCIVGYLAGFVVAAAILYVLNMYSNIIKSEDEFKEKSKLALLGVVPDFFSIKGLNIPHNVRSANKKIKKVGSDEKLITDFTVLNGNSPFVVTEAYNLIRTNLLFTLSTSDKKTIVISSSFPNECKSTTAVNVAISMAQTGASVLLVEGDLRNPTLHRIFKTSNRHGLSRVLADLEGLNEAVVRGVRPGVDLLAGGPSTPNPSEMLGSDKMRNLLEHLSGFYDYIFIDTPPVNVVADALLLANYAAGIVLIAREDKTKYKDLNKAVSKLETAKSNLLGVIITDSEKMSSGYKDYKYGYGYGYGQHGN